MTVSQQQAERLLNGSFTFKQLGFSMLITRLKMLYLKDSSPSSLQTCTKEINIFLEKFKSIMSEDINVIAKI